MDGRLPELPMLARWTMPLALSTANRALVVAGQIRARWKGTPSCRPPPGFLVSM